VTATCHRDSPAAYCDALPAEIDRLAAALGALDPATRVPTCPDWSIEDLGVHVGTVHRWAMNQVRVLTPERISSATMGIQVPEAAGLAAWVREGTGELIETFRAADADAEMWGWGSDRHARFWPRRMMHETTVHRADAEFAAGRDPAIDRAVAADGIDEFLDNLPHAAYFAPRVDELRGTGEQIALRATDIHVGWTITLRNDDFVWDHTGGDATAALEGSAGDLLLYVYGRRTIDDGGRFTVSGDRALLDFWTERSKI